MLKIYEGAAIWVDVPITDDAGGAVDLSSGTVTARLWRPDRTGVDLTAEVRNAAGGLARARLTGADLQRGVCVLLMRAAIGSDSEIVADREIYVARAV